MQQEPFKTYPEALILPEILPLNFEFGGMTGIEEQLIFPDGNLMPWLPEYEQQIGVYFDDYGCVSRSFLNALEAVIARSVEADIFSHDTKRWLIKEIYLNNKPNFSDRDLIVLSGTVPKVGNSGWKVFETAKDEGLVSQEIADWDFTNRNPLENSSDKYYAYARDKKAIEKAEEFNNRFEIKAEWVAIDKIKEASKYGALQIYVNAWYKRGNKYYNPTGKHNHAVLLINSETLEIFDHYEPSIKQIESINDIYPWALKINIIEKSMKKPTIKNNSLVILVSGGGGIGLYLDGKIIIDNEAKINSVFMARNSKNGFFSGGPTISLTQEQWNLFEKRDLKGQVIS